MSCWVKRCTLGANSSIFTSEGAGVSSTKGTIRFDAADSLSGYLLYDGGWKSFTTNELFRDVSAWYHIVYIGDTTQGTASNRLKLYVNGVQETSFATATYPSEDYEWQLQAIAKNFGIGAFAAENAGASPSSFYLAEVVYLDGVAGSIGDFGEFDEDSPTIWKPIDVSGLTFGTNGFYLEFKQSGTSQNSSGLGADTSGNDNHFAVNNLTAIDQSLDTCTNNFATLNPLDNSTAVSFDLSQGNLVLGDIGSGDNDHGLRGTFGVNAGKWYYEVKRLETSGTFGVIGSDVKLEFDLENNTSGPAHIMSSNGTGSSLVYWNDGSFTNNASLQGYAANDIIGVALDMDNGKLFFSINGVFKGFDNNASDPAAGTNANFTDIPTDGTFMMPYVSKRGTANPSDQYNFGGTQSFTISSGNTDGNGFGNFEYAPPSGFLALCTKNLAESG